ncbi:RidA family protein [Rhizobium binxianense]
MKREEINALDAPQPRGGYSQAVKLENFERLLFISGQVPVLPGQAIPEDFTAQARQVWLNIDAQLRAAGMSKSDIVKINTYIADRSYAGLNRDVRSEYLGSLLPASTLVVAGLLDSAWLLEIEVVAAQ